MENNELNRLAEQLVSGTATESEQGVALKALQTALASSLVTGLRSLGENINNFNTVYNQIYQRCIEQFEIQRDTMDFDKSLNLLIKLQSQQYDIIDLYRKVVQGKELFPSDSLSEDDRKILRLVKSFKSPDDRRKFMSLVEETLSE